MSANSRDVFKETLRNFLRRRCNDEERWALMNTQPKIGEASCVYSTRELANAKFYSGAGAVHPELPFDYAAVSPAIPPG